MWEERILRRSSPPRRGCFSLACTVRAVLGVFPASAGVFPAPDTSTLTSKGLPRLGGGVSAVETRTSAPAVSSPPRRGCFCLLIQPIRKPLVFPASAGVFPSASMQADSLCGLPRLGGGVSVRNVGNPHGIRSSPPRRGCFEGFRRCQACGPVFPASAGVFLSKRLSPHAPMSLPRLGGGVPRTRTWIDMEDKSSPPRRGCFRHIIRRRLFNLVFPASAGVFLGLYLGFSLPVSLPRLGGGVSSSSKGRYRVFQSSPPRRGCFSPSADGTNLRPSLPRLGGGVSLSAAFLFSRILSSPPRRGCFSPRGFSLMWIRVFPAPAGVFLTVSLSASDTYGLPRLGGGVSGDFPSDPSRSRSSPPRRGCFQDFPSKHVKRIVFPASAGVFPAHLHHLHPEFTGRF